MYIETLHSTKSDDSKLSTPTYWMFDTKEEHLLSPGPLKFCMQSHQPGKSSNFNRAAWAALRLHLSSPRLWFMAFEHGFAMTKQYKTYGVSQNGGTPKWMVYKV